MWIFICSKFSWPGRPWPKKYRLSFWLTNSRVCYKSNVEKSLSAERCRQLWTSRLRDCQFMNRLSGCGDDSYHFGDEWTSPGLGPHSMAIPWESPSSYANASSGAFSTATTCRAFCMDTSDGFSSWLFCLYRKGKLQCVKEHEQKDMICFDSSDSYIPVATCLTDVGSRWFSTYSHLIPSEQMSLGDHVPRWNRFVSGSCFPQVFLKKMVIFHFHDGMLQGPVGEV